MIPGDDWRPAEEDGVEDPEGAEVRPSRSERTRAAALVTRLGLRLAALSSEELDRLELPERLREEVDRCQRMKPRARGRQHRLIGQLLRAEDHEAIRGRVESLRSGDRARVQQEKQNERWLVRLVDEGDAALEALIAEHPEADRGRMRALARSARQEAETPRSRRARRELLRAIRALRMGPAPPEW
jgi:ribosome-associated protein